MRASLCTFLLGSVLAFGTHAPAEEASDQALISGPPAETPLKPIRAYAERGPWAGQEFDVAEAAGTAPAAFLFIHDLSRNTAPVIREFDRLGREHALLGFEGFALMLQEDRTEGENLLKRVNGSLKLHRPLVLSLDGLDGPGDYALNRRCTLTLVLAREGQVTQSLALTDTGPADFPKLQRWIESVAGTLPQEEGALRDLLRQRLPQDTQALRELAINQGLEIRQLRQRLAETHARGQNRMRPRPAGRGRPDADARSQDARSQRGTSDPGSRPAPPAEPSTRQGKPPEDPELNQALRSFIRKTNEDGRTETIMKEIKTRAAQSEALKQEAIEMFKLMLSFRDRYGTPKAQELAQAFLKEHDAVADQKD